MLINFDVQFYYYKMFLYTLGFIILKLYEEKY